MRLHCDEMLRGLARWLRAAGHDATTARQGECDALVLAQAGAEGRALLTRDRGMMQHRAAAGLAVFLDAADLDGQAVELRRRLAVDWLHDPFSRCLVCNVPLRSAGPAAREALPASASDWPLPGPIRECPCCGRLYWPGSHVRRMRHRLKGWATGTHGT